MLVDSHCHLDFDDFRGRIPEVLSEMAGAGVTHALCISVTLPEFPRVRALAEGHPNLFASVGVHPDYPDAEAVSVAQLLELANHPKIVAIGETGLDYYRLTGDLEWQRRAVSHAHPGGKGLRQAPRRPYALGCRRHAPDHARRARGRGWRSHALLHRDTRSSPGSDRYELPGVILRDRYLQERSATAEVAKQLPLDRVLVETDAPYLAPVPHRGKINRPAWVRHVAEELARLREVSYEVVSEVTTRNFFQLFRHTDSSAPVEP